MTSSKPVEELRVHRVVPASPERVFDAWTNPAEIKQWWGPKDVECLSAEIDLRVGGQYRIANKLPDRTVLWIFGSYQVIEKPHLLVYTWAVEGQVPATERVKVQFEPHELGTDVVITHERIATEALSKQHEQGWIGCLEGLVNYLIEIKPMTPANPE